jgi:hypothetical protein
MIGAHHIQKEARSERADWVMIRMGGCYRARHRVGPVRVGAYLERNQSFRMASKVRLESLWSLIM